MVAGKSAPHPRLSSNAGRFYKRLFGLAGNERLKTQADQAQAHAHATGAMALDGFGLAGGLIATGARLGCGLGDLRLGLRCRCGLGSMTVAWTSNLGCGRLG